MSKEVLLLKDDAVEGEAYVLGPCEAHNIGSGYTQGQRPQESNHLELGLTESSVINGKEKAISSGEASHN